MTSTQDRYRFPDGHVHGVVGACQRSDGKWLLIRRSVNVAAPRQICFPGGGMEPGEKHEETLVRELWEELGVKVSPVKHIWHCVVPERRLTLWGWLARLEGEEVRHDPHEVEEPLWMTLEEILAHPEVMKNTELFVMEIRRAMADGDGSSRVARPESRV